MHGPAAASLSTDVTLTPPGTFVPNRGAIPPTVGTAFFQSTAVADYFSTLGYLVTIMSVLSLCVLPRGRYFQMLVLNLIFVSVGAAMSLYVSLCKSCLADSGSPLRST